MTVKTKLSHRILSGFLCVMLLLTCLPLSSLIVRADNSGTVKTYADPSTMNDWQQFFPLGNNINTENAGGIWTDKSVFTNDDAFSDITMTEQDSFLVALSAMGSNMSVTGMSNVPTDTILVLDASGSMENSASALVSAANDTITTLLDANKYNRVGVILYSGPRYVGGSNGGDAVVTLPLGRYTTSATDGEFLNLSGGVISLDRAVVVENTTTRPNTTSKEVVGGTYMQTGIILAKNQFTATGNSTTVNDNNMGTLKRKPVMVLMSDGAPTLASTDFTNPTTSNLGDGQSSSAAMGFSTQLSISYAKQQIETKYNGDALVYTLGVGLTTGTNGYQVARSVLNPSGNYTDASANSMETFWTRYNEATVGGTVTVSGRGNNAKRVTKISETLEQAYVDRYFAANSANDMTAAFKEIVADISLQSKYFPTLTEANENLSGYVTFVDNIGKYMEVTKVEGIRLHQTLFSGADLASNFVAGGGALGTFDAPTTLGDELVRAVRERIGVDADTARTLIGLAYENKQLSYNPTTGEFSNYIGWFADADGNFLGFWHEGVSISTTPANAVYIMKSYGYLGETDATQGVEKSDMMYATVQVRERITDGEQTVTFAIPAALIPTVTYEVTLDETGNLEKLETSGATAPIRLVYKVTLREYINEYTVNDVVDPEYIEANKNADGSINFYTNQYEVDNSTGYQKINTFSYFRPSRQNDRYYYQQASLIYTDTNGAEYHGDAKPTGEMYHAYTVYFKDGTTLDKKTVYHRLTDETLDTAERTANADTWYIPEGDVRRDYAGYVQTKDPENVTGTLPFSAAPFTDIEGHSVNDTNHFFVVGATLGNNGLLTLDRETGIRITKTMAIDSPVTDESFEFVITNTTNTADNTTYPAYKISADGTESTTAVKFTNGIAANISLKANEILYIGGMTADDVINVKEIQTDKYAVETVNNKFAAEDNLTVEAYIFRSADFVNVERGTGNLTISKNVEHPFSAEYNIPTDVNAFKMTVTLTLDGQPLANRTYNGGAVETDQNGQIKITLKDGEQFEISGLPAGTEATVVETDLSAGFTASYWDNGAAGDGVVTVEADRTSSVIVVNTYKPNEVYPVNIELYGTKTLTGRTPNEWIAADVYTFVLEEYDFATQSWTELGERTVDKDTVGHKFDFNAIFSATTFKFEDAGTYYYRVRESAGTVAGVTYDTTLHSFAVEVTDLDMDGQLEIASVTETRNNTEILEVGGVYTVNTDFSNVYNADETNATISITKKVNNESGSPLAGLDGFEFEVYEYNPSTNQTGAKLTTSLPTSMTGTTRIIRTYDTAGTYHYAVKEVGKEVAGWRYSTEVAYVTVDVDDDGSGNLVAVAYTTSATGATSTVELEFTNTYAPTKAQLPITFVNKTLSGRDMKANEFTFKLTAVNASELVDAEGDPITEIVGKNDAQGNVTFTQPLYFGKVGTFFYDIKEETGTAGGVSYDKNTYRLVVTVADDNGVLKATYQVLNVQGSEITFKNTYTTQNFINSIGGTKELTGRALLNDEFTFVMTEAIDSNGTIATGAKSYYAKNSTTARSVNVGEFWFPEIHYSTAGTYYYVVTEQGATGTSTYGIEYDNTEYVVTLVVADDGEGSLYKESISHDVAELKFKNEYVARPTAAVIPGNKILEGRVLNDAEFSFELYNSNAAWAELDKKQTVQNAPDGHFEFDEISFTAAGTYYYLVKETEGNKGGITYDNTVFRVKVEITDDLMGQLHSSVFIFDDYDIPQAGIEFVNIYTITGSDKVPLEGKKTLTGRDMTDGEFTFELYKADSEFNAEDNVYKTATNQDEMLKFELEFFPTDVGETFYYVVREKNAGETLKGVTYSNLEYHISVEVKDNGEGEILTVTNITAGDVPTTKLDFQNEFKANTSVDIFIEKKVENKGGESITPEGFKFLLEKVGTDEEVKVTADAEGKAQINLPFTEKDAGETYTYKLTEVNDGRTYVKYSQAEYLIEVELTLNDEDELVATVTYGQEEIEALEAEFVNEYDYTPPVTEIPVTGDTSNISLWIALMFVSGGVLIGTTLIGRRARRKAE